jgi:hypothetical protein
MWERSQPALTVERKWTDEGTPACQHRARRGRRLSYVDTTAAAPEQGAPPGGVVPGLTGAAARVARAAADLHTAWGIFFNDKASQGPQASHTVLNVTTTGGDFVYAPTALPPGGACNGMATAYTPTGPKLWFYASGENRSLTISANGGAATSVNAPSTGGWDTVGSVTATMNLTAGTNTIRIGNPSGWDRTSTASRSAVDH